MDLSSPITLVSNGKSIDLPLINLLRITLVKLQPLIIEYLEQTSEPTVKGLMDWLVEKLEMRGTNGLL